MGEPRQLPRVFKGFEGFEGFEDFEDGAAAGRESAAVAAPPAPAGARSHPAGGCDPTSHIEKNCAPPP
ncbi:MULTISPECIES: hypothetical protein [unclassified Streptomyces]|uniref:hypothetical protein n=1 Tax=unclassified Streptomyces TaxID=2593676 RepID=UPI00093C819F|nr:hypothetical protein [Streptomyces sp. TSRI0281]OKI32293.1 hypothetical protein A6A29_22525 [Streptomyces sp. TSRI0281]